MKIAVDGVVVYDDSVPEDYCDLMGEIPNHLSLSDRRLSDMDNAPLDKMRGAMLMLARKADEMLSERFWNS